MTTKARVEQSETQSPWQDHFFQRDTINLIMSHIKSICTKKMKATHGDIYVACGSSPKEPQPQPAFQSPATSFILYRKLNFSSWVLFSFRMSIKSLAVIFMNTKTRPPGHISAKSKSQLQIYQAVSQTHNEKNNTVKIMI